MIYKYFYYSFVLVLALYFIPVHAVSGEQTLNLKIAEQLEHGMNEEKLKAEYSKLCSEVDYMLINNTHNIDLCEQSVELLIEAAKARKLTPQQFYLLRKKQCAKYNKEKEYRPECEADGDDYREAIYQAMVLSLCDLPKANLKLNKRNYYKREHKIYSGFYSYFDCQRELFEYAADRFLLYQDSQTEDEASEPIIFSQLKSHINYNEWALFEKKFTSILPKLTDEQRGALLFDLLIVSINSKNPEYFNYIMREKPWLRDKEDYFLIPFLRAVKNDNEHYILTLWQYYQQQGVLDQILIPSSDKETTLSYAAGLNRKALVLEILSANIDINGQGDEGLVVASPVYESASNGHFDMVRLLVERGASLNHTEKYNQAFPILGAAARSGKLELVKYLLDKGALVSDNHRKTLYLALKGGSVAILSLLFETGLKIPEDTRFIYSNLGSCMGDSGRNFAKLCEGESLFNLLLKNGLKLEDEPKYAIRMARSFIFSTIHINKDTKDREKKLQLADEQRRYTVTVVKALLAAGFDPDTLVNRDYTLLMMSASNGIPELVKFLLDSGADKSIQTKKKKTALSMAREQLKYAKNTDHGIADLNKIIRLLGGKPNTKNQ